MKKYFIYILLSLLVIGSSGCTSGNSGGGNAPVQKAINFSQVGGALTQKIDNVFAQGGTLYISLTGQWDESVSYYTISEKADESVSFNSQSLILPSELADYTIMGNIITGQSTGSIYLPVYQLDESGNFNQSLLRYSNTGVFINNLGQYASGWIKTVDYGYEDAGQIYLNVDSGTAEASDLCWLQIDGTAKVTCAKGILPVWYQDIFADINNKLYYYSGKSAFEVNNSGGAPRQVGQNDTELASKGYFVTAGPQLYQDRLYMLAEYALDDKGNWSIAVCNVPFSASSSQSWECKVDLRHKFGINDNANNFTIDQQTGIVIAGITDQKDLDATATTRFYQAKL